MNTLFSIFDLKNHCLTSPSPPSIHDFDCLTICTSGSLHYFLDTKFVELKAPFICYAPQNVLYSAYTKTQETVPTGWHIHFKNDLILENIFSMFCCYNLRQAIQFDNKDEFERYVKLCEILDYEHKQSPKSFLTIRSLLNAFFSMLYVRNKQNPQQAIAHQEGFSAFLKLLEANFKKDVDVDFYAREMNMSTRNLNLVCKAALDKSISEIIEYRKITEAKKLLITTNKTVSEICFELGYNEKAYFSSVFKKKTGYSPVEYKKSIQNAFS